MYLYIWSSSELTCKRVPLQPSITHPASRPHLARYLFLFFFVFFLILFMYLHIFYSTILQLSYSSYKDTITVAHFFPMLPFFFLSLPRMLRCTHFCEFLFLFLFLFYVRDLPVDIYISSITQSQLYYFAKSSWVLFRKINRQNKKNKWTKTVGINLVLKYLMSFIRGIHYSDSLLFVGWVSIQLSNKKDFQVSLMNRKKYVKVIFIKRKWIFLFFFWNNFNENSWWYDKGIGCKVYYKEDIWSSVLESRLHEWREMWYQKNPRIFFFFFFNKFFFPYLYSIYLVLFFFFSS